MAANVAVKEVHKVQCSHSLVKHLQFKWGRCGDVEVYVCYHCRVGMFLETQ